VLRPGRAVQTGFHRVPVLLLRTGEHGCDLLVPRSFAASLSEWIAEAARQFTPA
jgi:sarcosine oxidase subunit gamma